jgi:TolA-binding protein
VASPQDPEAAAAAFRQARELLLAAPLPDAEAAFADYLERFPAGEDAPDARYWLAFTMLGQGEYQNAASAFADYLQIHGNDPGPRNQTPAALLRLGISLAGMGMRNDACLAFRDAAAHPRASQTTRSQAAQEQRRNGCVAG